MYSGEDDGEDEDEAPSAVADERDYLKSAACLLRRGTGDPTNGGRRHGGRSIEIWSHSTVQSSPVQYRTAVTNRAAGISGWIRKSNGLVIVCKATYLTTVQ